MYKIHLKNNVSFDCDENSTIFEAAKRNKLTLEHSCLAARCSSCVVKIIKGTTVNKEEELVLSSLERKNKFVLSCNAKPTSDLILDVEDLGDVEFFEKKIIPSKIQKIEYLNDSVIELEIRLPPTVDFRFNSGQYVNIIHSGIKRSYSIANHYRKGGNLLFFIKKYEGGFMSSYLFEKAKLNNLLRIEGPIGTFFFRNSEKKVIIFLATGTGVAPVKSILGDLDENYPEKLRNKEVFVFVGARDEPDLFWKPKFKNIKIKYVPTLSRPKSNWNGNIGYVQDIVLKQNIDLKKAQVYACGSNMMIESSKQILVDNSLDEHSFFSDAFVQTN